MGDSNDYEIATTFTKSWSSESGPEDSWANDEIDRLVQEDPEGAWRVILLILSMTPPKTVLSILAAGPLENLLCGHGPAFLDRLQTEAEVNTTLRECLPYVWGESLMAPEVYKIVERIRKHGA